MPAERKDYVQFRSTLLDFIGKEIIGPEADNEVIDKRPTERYASGLLYPQVGQHEEQAITEARAEDEGEQTNDDEDVSSIEQTASFYPSAIGLSFCLTSVSEPLKVIIKAGQYEPMTKADFGLISFPLATYPKKFQDTELCNKLLKHEKGKLSLISEVSDEAKVNLQTAVAEDKDTARVVNRLLKLYETGLKRRRVEKKLELVMQHGSGREAVEGEQLQLHWLAKKIPGSPNSICTVALVNTNQSQEPKSDHLATYCQVSFSIQSKDSKSVFPEMAAPAALTPEAERESLELLYRNKKTFANGHGCSAAWQTGETGLASSVYTTYLPTYEIPGTSAELLEQEGVEMPDLSIKLYAYGSTAEVTAELSRLVSLYRKWIEDLGKEVGKLDGRYHSAAAQHIAACSESADRMAEGIELIKQDPMVQKAFRLANLAMVKQIWHSGIQKNRKTVDEANPLPSEEDYKKSDAAWRPFQLAFLIQSVKSIADDDSPERSLVDLIWFPTGGGKTEAYLGLTAFTILLRRLKHPDSDGGGTAVMMRYTLRLLTAQQFQRACTLICSLEILRRENTGELGEEPITIGLWLGFGSTPNTLADARRELSRIGQASARGGGNSFQILSCPWCGTHMTPQNGKGANCYREVHRPHHLAMYCPKTNCAFTLPGELPIQVVDEDIYNQPPTLLFGTVDKFAMLPWKEKASSIFALDDPSSTRLTPELIIQDELHLISGALGTMVGLYETAIDMMCSRKGRQPKIIASTATIRRASEQCMALYGRETRQFPAPGLNAEDSFFSREIPVSEASPGRLYVGAMPTGKTSTTMEVRLASAMIQGPFLLQGDDEVKDKYWTEVIYCNSIRELGTSKSIIYQDVEQHSSAIARRVGEFPRTYRDRTVEELTGRASGDRIPQILQQLDVSYPDTGALDVLLATSMLSVGVDIDRLSQMLVLGQPKTTSEYIQASSRVGRKFPGLVIMQYSPTKSRDRSHYEKFTGYHQSLYKEVEPTSVTPFAPPARDKALFAVLVILIRHLLGLHTPEQLREFDRNSPEVKEIVEQLAERVARIDGGEKDEFLEQVGENLDWISLMAGGENTIYGNTGNHRDPEKVSILRLPTDEKGIGKATPTSMRNTDAECYISIDYSRPGED